MEYWEKGKKCMHALVLHKTGFGQSYMNFITTVIALTIAD